MITHKQLLPITLILSLITPSTVFSAEDIFCSPSQIDSIIATKELYSRSQVDSIICAEIMRNFDTLAAVKSHEQFRSYIAEENNHLNRVEINIAIIGFVIALISVAVPFFINKNREKLIDARMEDHRTMLKEKITEALKSASETVGEYTKESQAKINSSIEEKLKEVNDTINNHDKSIKTQIQSMKDLQERVEKLAIEAKSSENAASKTAKSIKISELWDKYNNEDSPDKKIEILLKVLELAPNNLDVLQNLSDAYRDNKKYNEAIDCIKKVIELKPNASNYSRRADLYLMKEDFTNALNDISKAINEDPSNDQFYYWRGCVYEQNNQLDEAEKDLQTAINLVIKNGGQGINSYTSKLNQIKGEKELANNHHNNNNNKKKALLQAIKDNPHATIQELASSCNISKNTASRYISTMKRQGILRHIGPTKGGYWDIISDNYSDKPHPL